MDGEDSGDGTIEWPISYISLLQKRHHNVPFPEPWLFRYLCTSQVVPFDQHLKKQEMTTPTGISNPYYKFGH